MVESAGYMGAILRVDLDRGTLQTEPFPDDLRREALGGNSLGAKILYDEVPPRVAWDDPQNRLIFASGPLGGTRVPGSGTYSVVAKGPMTNLAGASQANGFFGAYLKFCGFDAIIFQGRAAGPVFLEIGDDGARLRDARALAGKDTLETEAALRDMLGAPGRALSVACIGPAGEHRVRFAMICGDGGHVAAHNGLGAVMGAKNLKAIALHRAGKRPPLHDQATLRSLATTMVSQSQALFGGSLHYWGTGGGFSAAHHGGWLPVRNYTTNLFAEHANLDGRNLRVTFPWKPNRCFACGLNHCTTIKVTNGPYAGLEAEEPEYEALSGLGSQLGIADPATVVMLTNTVDRLGLNVNEAGWVLGWLMECFERGLISHADTDGLTMTWGNAAAARAMLYKIAYREGCGALFAEGVKRAAEHFGGEAYAAGVFTLKGATPRGHDHRGRWTEMLDTCVGNTSTIEATSGYDPAEPLGVPPITDRFSPEQIARTIAGVSGRRPFDDSLGICRFCASDFPTLLQALNAATGWEVDTAGALRLGRRTINRFRAFNFRHGLNADLELPSPRYWSTPVDGPVAGKGIREHFPRLRADYYRHMGWDPVTGKPLPETLRDLGLEREARDLWG